MVAVIDYGVGNVFSLQSSLHAIGEEAIVTDDKTKIRAADRVILPGVGAFGDAADKLRERGLFDFVREIAGEGKPLLGICLGMQLLFDRSLEYGEHEGLGLVPGEVRPIEEVILRSLTSRIWVGMRCISFPGQRMVLLYIIRMAHQMVSARCFVISQREIMCILSTALRRLTVIRISQRPQSMVCH